MRVTSRSPSSSLRISRSSRSRPTKVLSWAGRLLGGRSASEVAHTTSRAGSAAVLLPEERAVEGLGLGGRVDAQLLGQDVPAPPVGPQRLGPVAGGPVGLHDQDVAGVAVGVEAEQLLGRVDGEGRLAQLDRRADHGVEGPHPQPGLAAAGGVEPLPLGARR